MIRLIFCCCCLGCSAAIAMLPAMAKGWSLRRRFSSISDKLSANTPVWEAQYNTQYTGTFNCSKSKSNFSYTIKLPTKDSQAAIFGFNDGQQWVRAEITHKISDRTLRGEGNTLLQN